MNKYNFFISYSMKDGEEIAKKFAEQLTEKGYSVFFDCNSIQSGSNWSKIITEAIANSDYFIPIITEGFISSAWALNELDFAFSKARSRATSILPIVANEIEISSTVLQYYINHLQQLKLDNSVDLPIAVNKTITEIDRAVGFKLKTTVLYEKLSEYKKINSYNKVAQTICELINFIREKYVDRSYERFTESWNLCIELLKLYEQLSKYVGSYDEESRKTAHKILDELGLIDAMLRTPSKNRGTNLFSHNLLFVSIALRIIYFDREIRLECVDVLSNGDVKNMFTVEKYIERQKNFVEIFNQQYEKIESGGFEDDKKQFIEETKKYIFGNIVIGSNMPRIPHKNKSNQINLSKSDEILISVAKFIQEGNKLFDVFQKNNIAGDFLECLRESYERLKNYCIIVGANDVAAECAERIVEIRNEADKQHGESSKNEKAEKGIKSLLGFTLEGSGKYDVFISFKSEDSDLAEKVYEYCHKNMKEPFWSKKTLPRLSESEYSKAIDMALENSKHFVVVLSDLNYLDAKWVSYEMDVFHNEIKEGRKDKTSNFIIVATDDVYDVIVKSTNKIVLPIAYRRYQIIKMSEYEESLAQYIS